MATIEELIEQESRRNWKSPAMEQALRNQPPPQARVDLEGSRFKTNVQYGTGQARTAGDAARAVPPRAVPVQPVQPAQQIGQVANPNVARGTPSLEAREYQAARAPATVANQPPSTTPNPAPDTRGYRAGRSVGNLARRIGPAAGGMAAVSGFGDYRINDPQVDSSAGGTIDAVARGDFAGAGRSLSKGALETMMDLGSSAAKVADVVVPGEQPVSRAYNRMLKDQFGDQLQDNTGIDSLRASIGLGPKAAQAATVPTQPQRQPNAQQAPVRQPLNTGSGQRGARTIAEIAPQYRFSDGETEGNVVQVIRPGSEISYATFGPNGPEGEVPAEVFNAGKTSQYRSAIADAAQRSLTDPGNALAKQELVNKGQVEQQRAANEGAEAAARVRAEADRLPKPEVLKDAMGNPTGTVNWRRTGDGFEPVVRPLSTPAAKPPSAQKARQEALDAIKRGASPAEVNARLESWGYPKLNLTNK